VGAATLAVMRIATSGVFGLLLGAIVASGAGSATASADPPVPISVQQQIAKRTVHVHLNYVPTWLPPKYHYSHWEYPVHLTSRHRVTLLKQRMYLEFTARFPCPGWCSDYPILSLSVIRIGGRPCESGYVGEKTYRFRKRLVQWGRFVRFGGHLRLSGSHAWRCSRSGDRRVLLVASSPAVKAHGPRPRALARFVASAHPVLFGHG
jgi:hypothetical protein